MKPVSDLHVRSNLPLPPPDELLARLPRTAADAEFIFQSRGAIRALTGRVGDPDARHGSPAPPGAQFWGRPGPVVDTTG